MAERGQALADATRPADVIRIRCGCARHARAGTRATRQAAARRACQPPRRNQYEKGRGQPRPPGLSLARRRGATWRRRHCDAASMKKGRASAWEVGGALRRSLALLPQRCRLASLYAPEKG